MPKASVQNLLRRIPGVDILLQEDALVSTLSAHPRKLVIDSIRAVLDDIRADLLNDPESVDEDDLELEAIVRRILDHIEQASDYTLRPVVNAGGIVIHTNLGRSLLAEEAVERLQLLCKSYNNLEYDLEKGRRGSRYVHAEAVLCELTGAEAALVVNNNAGAVFLVLSTLAKDREVVVSRGQLVEIGGSFRIPDVMRSSGAILRDVGCTNRTHLHDYENAITESTALLMKVHTSNYRIMGFTSEVSLEELVALGRRHGLPVVEDLGSGSFVDFSPYGLPGEPTVQDAVRSGADVVTFSGDKLLGGPQAGIILGRKDLIARCKKNPLTRAFRVDKMTLAALEVTLRLYRDEREALQKIPTLRMITTPPEVLERNAEELAQTLKALDTNGLLDIRKVETFSQVGGGSLPAQNLKSFAVSVHSPTVGTQKLESFLRSNKPPIIGRIESDRYLMDVRTLHEEDTAIIQEAFRKFLATISA